jgi:glycosyltransferase involved in cell wall biosynthesis
MRPASGGAYTLLETLKKDILASNCGYEIIIFFYDRALPKRFTENNISYINIYTKRNLLFRAARKFLHLLFKCTIGQTFDSILHDEDIDLLWLLGPYDPDITIPYVFTVWDLGHRMLPCFPEVSSEGWTWDSRENVYRKMLYRAAYVITGNETGKKEILANYAINPEKIRTIPFPIPAFCFAGSGQPLADIKSPFVFYPAQFWAHKNHAAVVEAIAWLRDVKNVVIYCYFAGSDKGNLNHIKNLINKYRLEDQIFILGFVGEETLIYLYKNALAMIFASLMGPNNLPPLEAAALGCPVILSNIPGHLEQMEGTGLPVDATDPSAIGGAVLSLFNDSEFRRNLIAAETAFIEKYKTYSYFKEMQKIVDAYSLFCKTWKEL